MTSPGFTLPSSLVDDARKEREGTALSSWATPIDSLVSEGMGALKHVASGVTEHLSPFAQALQEGGLKVPTLEDLTPQWVRDKQQQAQQAISTALTPPAATTSASGAPSARPASGTPQAMPTGAPVTTDDGSLEGWARSEARRLGIDPETAVRVANSEGGFDDPTRQSDVIYQGQRELSFGPYQLNVNGGLGSAALQQGIDPRNPAHARQAITYALEHAAKNGWSDFHGAARVGIGEREGIGQVPTRTPMPAEQAPAAQRQVSSTYTQQGLADAGDPDAWAKCGPVAAFQFAQKMGRNPTPAEVEKLARDAGWTGARGMAGFASEAAVLRGMNIPAREEAGVDWNKVITDVSRGNPVLLQLPGHEGHYITAQGYDPQTGKIDFGSTVGDLTAAGHKTQFTPSELEGLGWGVPTASLYVDNPATPAPSVAASPNAPVTVGQSPPFSGTSAGSAAPLPADASPLDAARASNQGGAGLAMRQPLSQQPDLPETPSDQPDAPLPTDSFAPGDGGTAPQPAPAMGPDQPYGPSLDETQAPAPSSPFKPLHDMVGNVIGYVQGAADQIGANMAQNRQNVEQANAGQEGGVDFGQGATNAATQAGQTVATEGIATPISHALSDPINAALGQPPAPRTGGPETPIDRAIVETGRSLGSNVEAVRSGVQTGDYGAAGLGALGVLGDLAPSTTLARQLNEMAPKGNFPIVGEVGLGDAIMTAALARDVVRLGYGAIKMGGRTAASIAQAIREGVPAERFGQWLAENSQRTAQADARMAAEGSTVAPGTFGSSWEEVSRRINRPDAPQPMDPALEGQVREQYGRRWQEPAVQNEIDQGVRQAAESRGGRQYTERPQDISGPVQIETDMSGRANVTAGTVPVDVPRDRLASVNNVLAQGVASTFSGGASAAAADQLGDPNDPNRQAKAFVAGAVLPPLMGRGIRGALRAAGRDVRGEGGALAALGNVPGRPDPARPRVLRGRPIDMTQAEEVSRLRLDKFPEALRPAIQEAAQAKGFAHDARRGVIPDDVAEQMADGVNRTVDDWITKSKAGKSLNTEETRALRNLVTGQAQKVDDLANEIADAEKGGVVTDLLITRAHQEGEKLAGLVSVMEGARAEAGRTLRAWTANARPTDPTEAAQRIFNKFGGGPEGRQRALDALKEFNEIPVDDPIARAGFWARVERGGKITSTDVLTAIRYNSMLSSPRTWEIGWIGSVLQAPVKIASDVMAQASRPMSGEMGEAAKGAALGIKAGLRPLWETAYHGITSDAALAGQLPRGLAARATSTPGKVAGTVVDLPGRMVAAPDAFFTQVFKGAETGRQAAIAAYKAGLKGEARDKFIQDFATNTPKPAEAEINRVVDGLMLRGDMGRIGRWASGVATKDPLIGSFVAPFMKVSYHIWTQGMDLTPVGAIGTGIDVLRGAYRGGARPTGVRPLGERARANAIGVGITGAATWQALHGNVSGAGPDDPEKRDELTRLTGWQPYSVKLGDNWVSYANWGPVAVPLSLAAAYAENQQYKKPTAKPEDQMFDMAKRVTKLVTEQTFLQGIGTIMNAFEDPQRYLPQFLAQQATSLIPYGSGLNTVGQSQDDYQRRPDKVADVGVAENLRQAVESRIPMNPLTPDRSDVPIAQGPLGEPVKNQQSGPMAFQPFRISPQRDDQSAAVGRAYLDIGVDLAKPPSSFTSDGVKIDMTPDQQRAYQRYMGDYIQKGFARANNASDRRRAEQLKTLYEDAREAASTRVQSEIGRSEIRNRVRAGGQR